jgi:putative ABC transport system permease protein
MDVQKDQRAGLETMVTALGASVRSTIPIVPMRVLTVKGRPVTELLAAPGTAEKIRSRWALRRQFMTTYRDRLTPSERVVEGRFWEAGASASVAPGVAVPVSITTTLIRELDVRIGDEIEWDVQGVTLLSRVTNVRDVEWARFEPNFLVLFPEGPLAQAPQMFAILARIEDGNARARVPREVSATFPNVSALDLTQVLKAAEELVSRMVVAIRFMGLFSLAAGAIVLIGAISAGRRQRIREGVLLKTLGATRAQVLRILTAEYGALGLLSAVAALGLSTAAGFLLMRFAFESRFAIPAGALFGLAAAVVTGTIGVGLLGSREVFRHTPLEVLREE